MPRKKRHLRSDLRAAGFREDKDRGQGSHTTWYHPAFPDITVVLSGHDGDDAKYYEEKKIREAIAEISKRLSSLRKEVVMSDDVDRSPLRPEELVEVRRYALVIEWSDEDQVFLVTAPDLPGMVTHGNTRTEAAEMGEEATAVWISSHRDRGQPVPEPRFTALPECLRPAAATTRTTGTRRSA
jgi:predicted RNase H-like HicB family nuclease/predicted RNA binding protein YcfA (HicA-like mRNA interferase family)